MSTDAKKYEYVTKCLIFEGRRYKIRGKTEREAERNKQRKIDELEAGKAAFAKNKTILFKDYAKLWLATHKQKLPKTTRKNIEYRLNKHVFPYIGHMRIRDITRSDLISVLNRMGNLSRDSVAKVRQAITGILQAAYDDGYLLKIPNIHTNDMPECSEPEERRPLTSYEREIALRVAEKHHAGGWVAVMLFCGLRPQEAAVLQGRHVDRKKMQITVEQARKRDNSVDEPKSRAGRRTVPIPPQLLPYLPKVEPFDYLFKSAGRVLKGGEREPGKWLNVTNARRTWLSFLREMNIAAGCPVFRNALVPCMKPVEGCGHGCVLLMPDYIRDGFGKRDYPIADDLIPYYFRHTYGCDCASAGVDIDLLSKLMGHANISTTSKYYLHMTDVRMEQAADLIAKYHTSH